MERALSVIRRLNWRRGLFRLWTVAAVPWSGYWLLLAADSFLALRRAKAECAYVSPDAPPPPEGFVPFCVETPQYLRQIRALEGDIEDALLIATLPVLLLVCLVILWRIGRWVVAGFLDPA